MSFLCRNCGKLNNSFNCQCERDKLLWDKQERLNRRKDGTRRNTKSDGR